MTLITVGFDTELLLRQLRKRLTYVVNRIVTEQRRSLSGNTITECCADGALAELYDQHEWLVGLIAQIEQGE